MDNNSKINKQAKVSIKIGKQISVIFKQMSYSINKTGFSHSEQKKLRQVKSFNGVTLLNIIAGMENILSSKEWKR